MKDFIFISIFVLLISCQKNSNIGNIEKIRLYKALDNVDKIALSEITDSVKYIRLETNKNCLITKINKIYIQDNYLFINNDKTKLMVFDLEGKFLNEIGSIGKGPGEFITLTNFFVDKQKDRILIFDQNQAKLMEYDFEGNYLNDFSLNYYPSNVEKLGDSYYFISNIRLFNDSIICQYSNGVMVNKLSKGDLFINNFKSESAKRIFTVYNDSITYWNELSNLICRIKGGNVEKRYELSFGKFKVDDDLLSKQNITYKEKYSNKGMVDCFIETKNYFFINAFFELKAKRIFYNKNNKTIFVLDNKICDKNKLFNNYSFVNDFDGVVNFWPDGIINDSILYQSFYAYNFKESSFCNNNKAKDMYSKTNILKEYIEESSYSDNPIIMLLKLR